MKSGREKRLMCVSQNDLVAPYSERERERHEELCAVLEKHFGIVLELGDFMDPWEEDGGHRYTINPLLFAEVKGANRLLVVNCSYTMKEERTITMRRFEIAPTSVEFSLFECA